MDLATDIGSYLLKRCLPLELVTNSIKRMDHFHIRHLRLHFLAQLFDVMSMVRSHDDTAVRIDFVQVHIARKNSSGLIR